MKTCVYGGEARGNSFHSCEEGGWGMRKEERKRRGEKEKKETNYAWSQIERYITILGLRYFFLKERKEGEEIRKEKRLKKPPLSPSLPLLSLSSS